MSVSIPKRLRLESIKNALFNCISEATNSPTPAQSKGMTIHKTKFLLLQSSIKKYSSEAGVTTFNILQLGATEIHQ